MSSATPDADGVKALHREFIQTLFESEFHVPVKDITTLARCNNNFIHHVTFSSPCASSITLSNQPGTSPILPGTTKAVFRIGNPASMFNHAVKVENTVAVMQLMRQALSESAIFPHVYGWSKDGGPSGNGWIIEQHMPGVDIEAKFHADLPKDSQRYVLSQIAEILKMVQSFKLPPAAANFGGLAFDGDGNVISGSYVVEPYTGPYPDMKTFYKKMLQAQLAEADRSPVAEGWRENGLRKRLDTFAEEGLDEVLSKTITKHVEPCLIIGDVVIANFLFHPTTYKVLGLVDYDCSHTGHPLHEFFFSSFSLSYLVISDNPAVNAALLHGFPSPLLTSAPPSGPEYRDDDAPQWPVMAVFEEELARVQAERPSSIEGAEAIAEMYKFISEVCPFFFVMQRWIDRQSKEKLQEKRREQGALIENALAKWGF